MFGNLRVLSCLAALLLMLFSTAPAVAQPLRPFIPAYQANIANAIAYQNALRLAAYQHALQVAAYQRALQIAAVQNAQHLAALHQGGPNLTGLPPGLYSVALRKYELQAGANRSLAQQMAAFQRMALNRRLGGGGGSSDGPAPSSDSGPSGDSGSGGGGDGGAGGGGD
jgi:hypothetical protein